MRLRKLASTLALGLALAGATLAHASFNVRMNLDRIEYEVRSLRATGKSIDTIAVAALRAHLEPGEVTAALVISGYTPVSVVRAMLGAGAVPAPVCTGLLVAGLRYDVAREYFEIGAIGKAEACPPEPDRAGSPTEVTAGVGGTGGGGDTGGGSGPVASPN